MKKRFLALAAAGIVLCVAAASLLGSRAVELAMARLESEASPQLPVLMYHAVMDSKKRVGDYVITPEALREDLDYLKREGYATVVMADILAYVKDGAPLPEKPVMLTFDDGYYNNYLYVYPLLQEYGMKAVISVIAAETERFSATDEKSAAYSHLTWEMINEMKDSGLVEFQNHSYDLHKVGARKGAGKRRGESAESYRALLLEDLGKAQQLYLENTGWQPTTFTYPFGSYSADSEAVLRELGFEASLGVEGKVFRPTRDPACLVRIPRFNRPWGKSAQRILEKAAG